MWIVAWLKFCWNVTFGPKKIEEGFHGAYFFHLWAKHAGQTFHRLPHSAKLETLHAQVKL